MKLGLMYSIIHDRIKGKVDRDNCIPRKELQILLARIYHIPKEYKHQFLNELIKFEIVKLERHDVLKVL